MLAREGERGRERAEQAEPSGAEESSDLCDETAWRVHAYRQPPQGSGEVWTLSHRGACSPHRRFCEEMARNRSQRQARRSSSPLLAATAWCSRQRWMGRVTRRVSGGAEGRRSARSGQGQAWETRARGGRRAGANLAERAAVVQRLQHRVAVARVAKVFEAKVVLRLGQRADRLVQRLPAGGVAHGDRLVQAPCPAGVFRRTARARVDFLWWAVCLCAACSPWRWC